MRWGVDQTDFAPWALDCYGPCFVLWLVKRLSSYTYASP